MVIAEKFLLHLPFTLDIRSLYDHRRITERYAKYKTLIIVRKIVKYTIVNFNIPFFD